MNDTPAAVYALKHKNCLPEAVVDIFTSMCGISIERADADAAETIAGNGVVVAVISLVGDIEWSVCLGLPRETAEAATEKFAGFAVQFESDDMGDAVGELANILAGEVKSKLDALGVNVEISLPSVIRGNDMHVLVQHGRPSETTLFASDCGPLWAEVVAAGDVASTRATGE